MFLHTECRAIVRFRCIGSYHIIALDASSLTVSLSELKDAKLRAEFLLTVLRWPNVFERISVLTAPETRTDIATTG